MEYYNFDGYGAQWEPTLSQDEIEEQEHSEIDSLENEYEGTALSPPYDIGSKDEDHEGVSNLNNTNPLVYNVLPII